MVELIQNPRRSPRAPARCRVSVVSAHGAFEATTEDVGAHGCQLVSPRLVRQGEPVQLELVHDAMKEPLRLAARVAWASERAPWRLGIAFDEAFHHQSTRWFERLLTSVPGLSPFRRIPERIPVDAAVYLATPPRFLVDFTPDEVALLRSIGSGAAIAELRAQLRDRWPPALRALFSLLAHNHVTLSRGGSVHPDAWKKILAEAEASLAVESLRGPEPQAAAVLTPAPPRPVLRAAPARAAVPAPPALPSAPVIPATGAWPVQPAPAPAARAWPAAAAAPAWPPPPAHPAQASAGPWSEQPLALEPIALETGDDPGAPEDWLASAAEMMTSTTWGAPPASRGGARGLDVAPWSSPAPPAVGPPAVHVAPPAPVVARSPEAQGCYERALAELQAGRAVGATVLLGRALALAPGDPEITAALASASGVRRTR